MIGDHDSTEINEPSKSEVAMGLDIPSQENKIYLRLSQFWGF